jgi:hypothetical protein
LLPDSIAAAGSPTHGARINMLRPDLQAGKKN